MGEHVLVVDDDPTTTTLVTDALTGAGYTVSSVGNGQEALRALAMSQPDLVVLDVMMPGMNGLAVLTMIKTQPGTRHLPVVMLTARDRYDDKLWGKLGGADRYLTKPFNPDTLVAAVRQVLDQRLTADAPA